MQQLHRSGSGCPRAIVNVYPIDSIIGRLAYSRSSSLAELDLTVPAESQTGIALQRAHRADGADWAGEKQLFYLRTPARVASSADQSVRILGRISWSCRGVLAVRADQACLHGRP